LEIKKYVSEKLTRTEAFAGFCEVHQVVIAIALCAYCVVIICFMKCTIATVHWTCCTQQAHAVVNKKAELSQR